MKISINQPYFFPYIGYYQLIYASDIFVSYDNVNYSNITWVSKNFIMDSNKKNIPINLSLDKKSQNKKINELNVLKNDKFFNKFYSSIKWVYSKSPNFQEIYQIIDQSFMNENISEINFMSLKYIFEYLGIEKKLYKSSEYDLSINNTKKVDKLISIMEINNCDTYYNLIGGKKIYNKQDFIKKNKKIYFVESESKFKCSFLHLLFTKNKYEIHQELNKFKLV